MAQDTLKHSHRRLNPRIWDSDYVLLTKLRESLETALANYVSPIGDDIKLVDYGCGELPYKQLIKPYVSSYIGCDLKLTNWQKFIQTVMAECH